MTQNTTKQRSRAPKFFEVRGFDKLQHRVTDSRTGEQKSLPWIKLYAGLLDDPDFEQLPDASKFHYIGLLLLARRIDNHLPYDAEYLSRKLSATSCIDLELFLQRKLIIPSKRKKIKDDEYAPGVHPKRTKNALDKTRREETETTTDETVRSAPPTAVGTSSGGVVRGVFGSTGSDQSSQNNGSIHPPEVIRAYLEDCQRQGQSNIRSIDAVVATLHRTGRSDEVIQCWLDRHTSASLDTGQCPDCHGSGVFYPNGFDKGVAKCKHEKISDTSVIQQQVAG
jgi:hypothetical protein